MRGARIAEQNRNLLERQRQFRVAADVIADAWRVFPEVLSIAVIGSVAKPLWKEVPRFREFRRCGIELWHECGDLDLAVWLESRDRLGELRRARDRALRQAFENGSECSVAGHQVDVFLFEPASDRFLGRLCNFNACPKGKPDCYVPGCGAVAFNKIIADFEPHPDLLAGVLDAVLYEKGKGRVRSALDLSLVEPQ